ncbi:MAG TPA: MFS transporter [Streptosporangiaceae bacterium]|nr:MFS transporter [Streptosporangiaceae bacterium]
MATTLASAGSRLWAPVRVTSFRRLWLGQSFSLLGDGFSYVAFSWITLSLTRSTLVLGYVLAMQAVPRAALTLVGGSLSDKWSARVLMALSSWARTIVMTAVAAIGFAHLLSIWMLLVAAAAFGSVDAFFQPARASILPSVVEKDLLAPANSLLSVGSRISAVLGPAVGGIVVAVSDARFAFLVDGVCFALCGLCVSRVIPLPKPRAGKGPESGSPADPAVPESKDTLLARIRIGLRYAWQDPRIRTMLVVDTAVTFCYAGPFNVGFADLAKFHLSGGAAALGLLSGSLAGGALLGALAGGLVGRQLRVGLLVAALAGWLAVGMTMLGIMHNVAAAVGIVLAMGFAIGFQGVFGISWVQRNIHGSVLSRVISIDMLFGYIAAPVSLVLCGAFAQTRLEEMFGGIALILAITALGILSSKPVREMK